LAISTAGGQERGNRNAAGLAAVNQHGHFRSAGVILVPLVVGLLAGTARISIHLAVVCGGFLVVLGVSHPSRSSRGSPSARIPAAVISWYCATDSRQTGSGGMAGGISITDVLNGMRKTAQALTPCPLSPR
jgi:hypothetical protein